MILRPQMTRILQPSSAVLRSASMAAPVASNPVMPNQVLPRVALNLSVKRINVEGLSSSERGVFLSAFQAQVNVLAQAAGDPQRWTRFLQSPHAARIRRIDGGMLPPGVDAKRMGERAADAIFRELFR
jgi:hypothetical protein